MNFKNLHEMNQYYERMNHDDLINHMRIYGNGNNGLGYKPNRHMSGVGIDTYDNLISKYPKYGYYAVTKKQVIELSTGNDLQETTDKALEKLDPHMDKMIGKNIIMTELKNTYDAFKRDKIGAIGGAIAIYIKEGTIISPKRIKLSRAEGNNRFYFSKDYIREHHENLMKDVKQAVREYSIKGYNSPFDSRMIGGALTPDEQIESDKLKQNIKDKIRDKVKDINGFYDEETQALVADDFNRYKELRIFKKDKNRTGYEQIEEQRLKDEEQRLKDEEQRLKDEEQRLKEEKDKVGNVQINDVNIDPNTGAYYLTFKKALVNEINDITKGNDLYLSAKLIKNHPYIEFIGTAFTAEQEALIKRNVILLKENVFNKNDSDGITNELNLVFKTGTLTKGMIQTSAKSKNVKNPDIILDLNKKIGSKSKDIYKSLNEKFNLGMDVKVNKTVGDLADEFVTKIEEYKNSDSIQTKHEMDYAIKLLFQFNKPQQKTMEVEVVDEKTKKTKRIKVEVPLPYEVEWINDSILAKENLKNDSLNKDNIKVINNLAKGDQPTISEINLNSLLPLIYADNTINDSVMTNHFSSTFIVDNYSIKGRKLVSLKNNSTTPDSSYSLNKLTSDASLLLYNYKEVISGNIINTNLMAMKRKFYSDMKTHYPVVKYQIGSIGVHFVQELIKEIKSEIANNTFNQSNYANTLATLESAIENINPDADYTMNANYEVTNIYKIGKLKGTFIEDKTDAEFINLNKSLKIDEQRTYSLDFINVFKDGIGIFNFSNNPIFKGKKGKPINPFKIFRIDVLRGNDAKSIAIPSAEHIQVLNKPIVIYNPLPSLPKIPKLKVKKVKKNKSLVKKK